MIRWISRKQPKKTAAYIEMLEKYQLGIDGIEEGLSAIRATPARQVRAEVTAAYTDVAVSPARRRFADADPHVLDTLVTAMRSFFHQVLAPDWAALNRAHRRSVGEAANRYAFAGADGVLASLHPAIRWRAPVLEVDTWQDGEARLGGHGLILLQSIFAGPRPRVLAPPDRPALVVYPVAPTSFSPSAADPLAGLLGRTRSAVLLHAARPGRHTTSTIARQVGISVSSSSEHLSALRAAGLIASRREGGAIVHSATALCRDLVNP